MNTAEKRVALVTGSTSGIGLATAKKLHKKGWTVVATGRNEEKLQQLKDEAIADHIIVADLMEADAAEAVIKETLEVEGRIDGIAHAAGIISSSGMDNENDEGFHLMMETNVNSSWRILKRGWEALKETKGAAVLVSSVCGLRPFPSLVSYCVSKSAVDQLVRCAALDGAPHGVRVNGVNPGVVVTELHKRSGMDEEAYAKFLAHSNTTHPLGRTGKAEEIAEAISWLLSPETGWITGVNLAIDGGRQLTCNR